MKKRQFKQSIDRFFLRVKELAVQFFADPPEKVFLKLALPFGLLFLFLSPPFQAPDEQVHFFRVFQIKQFDLRGERVYPFGAGAPLPSNFNQAAIDLVQQPAAGAEISKYDVGRAAQYLFQLPDAHDRALTNFPNTVVYSPVPYMVHLIGAFISDNVMHLGIIPIIYFMRLVGFFVWLLVIYFLIRFIPYGKWVLVTIGLIPTTIYQATTINADTFTTLITFSFITLVLYLYANRSRLLGRDYVALLSTATLLNLAKPGYIIVTAISLILVSKIDGGKLKRILTVLVGLFIAAIPFVIWMYLVKDLSAQIPLQLKPGANVDVAGQIANIIHSPTDLLYAYFISIFSNYGSGILIGIVGSFGWIDYPLPFWMIAIGVFLIIFSLVYASKDEIKLRMNKVRDRLWIFVVFIASVLFLMLVLYLTWTPVGFRRVDGFQGRYLIPLIPLLIPVLQTRLFAFSIGDALRAKIIITGTVILLLFSILFLLMRFWIGG